MSPAWAFGRTKSSPRPRSHPGEIAAGGGGTAPGAAGFTPTRRGRHGPACRRGGSAGGRGRVARARVAGSAAVGRRGRVRRVGRFLVTGHAARRPAVRGECSGG